MAKNKKKLGLLGEINQLYSNGQCNYGDGKDVWLVEGAYTSRIIYNWINRQYHSIYIESGIYLKRLKYSSDSI